MLIGNLNSCVNPWIYITFNAKQTLRALRLDRHRHDRSSERLQTAKKTVIASDSEQRSRNRSLVASNGQADECANSTHAHDAQHSTRHTAATIVARRKTIAQLETRSEHEASIVRTEFNV